MSNFNQAEYVSTYHRDNIKQIKINLNKEYDADIIEHLNNQANKQGYLKNLIRQDMRNAQ